jgi:hypothetical protein
MLCCLVGGLLVAALVRAARRRRAHNPLLALAFGFGSGALVVELVMAVLVPLGSVQAPGSLAARLLMLILPAFLAGAAGLAGAAASLLSRGSVVNVAAAAVGGAIAAEVLDLHVLHLHSGLGLFAAVAIHAPAFLFLAGGLLLRSMLPDAVAVQLSCECDAERRTVAF